MMMIQIRVRLQCDNAQTTLQGPISQAIHNVCKGTFGNMHIENRIWRRHLIACTCLENCTKIIKQATTMLRPTIAITRKDPQAKQVTKARRVHKASLITQSKKMSLKTQARSTSANITGAIFRNAVNPRTEKDARIYKFQYNVLCWSDIQPEVYSRQSQSDRM